VISTRPFAAQRPASVAKSLRNVIVTPYPVRSVEISEEEGMNLTIFSVLIALFADHVMGSVAATRRAYLTELNRYLDDQGSAERPTRRRTSS
jgi:hypothetical protein